MYTINTAERALRKHFQSENALKQYSIAVLRELCIKRHLQVDVGSRSLKKPYIEALLTYVK